MKASGTRRDRAFRVAVDHAVCDGCGICLFFCRPTVFELSRQLNRRGIYPALPHRADLCNGCRLCEVGCPQLAILVSAVNRQEATP